jgi:hypothetical protein
LASEQICLAYAGYVWFVGRICPIKLDLALQKNRSGDKMMNLGPDKLTTCKLNTMELRELRRTIRSNLITRNHT